VLWHVGLAAAGVSALIAAHPQALDALRWIGAGYLVWLAWKAWNAGPEGPGTGHASLWRAWRKGVLTNMLNPKPVLFVLAFLPQFVVADGPPVWQQIVTLGLIFAFTGTLVTMGYGLVAGFAGQALARRMGIVNRLAAVLFAGLALRLVSEG
jgi:threonine/homoserine/homoserine lactone efflux protein